MFAVEFNRLVDRGYDFLKAGARDPVAHSEIVSRVDEFFAVLVGLVPGEVVAPDVFVGPHKPYFMTGRFTWELIFTFDDVNHHVVLFDVASRKFTLHSLEDPPTLRVFEFLGRLQRWLDEVLFDSSMLFYLFLLNRYKFLVSNMHHVAQSRSMSFGVDVNCLSPLLTLCDVFEDCVDKTKFVTAFDAQFNIVKGFCLPGVRSFDMVDFTVAFDEALNM